MLPKADWSAVFLKRGQKCVYDGVYRSLRCGHPLFKLADSLIADAPAKQILLQHRGGPLPELHASEVAGRSKRLLVEVNAPRFDVVGV